MKKLLFISLYLIGISAFGQTLSPKFTGIRGDLVYGRTSAGINFPHNYSGGQMSFTINDTLVHEWVNQRIQAALVGISDSTESWRTKSDFPILKSNLAITHDGVAFSGGPGSFTVISSEGGVGSGGLGIHSNQSNLYWFDPSVNALFTILDENGISFFNEITEETPFMSDPQSSITYTAPTDNHLLTVGIANSTYAPIGVSSIDSVRVYDSLSVHRDSINAISSFAHGLSQDFWPLSGDFSTDTSQEITFGGQTVFIGNGTTFDALRLNTGATASNYIDIESNDETSAYIGVNGANNGTVFIGSSNPSFTDLTEINLDQTNGLIFRSSGTGAGGFNEARYAHDYSSTYNLRSITDKNYQDTNLRGISLPTTSGQTGNSIRVNGAGTAWEYYTPGGGGVTVNQLSDTAQSVRDYVDAEITIINNDLGNQKNKGSSACCWNMDTDSTKTGAIGITGAGRRLWDATGIVYNNDSTEVVNIDFADINGVNGAIRFVPDFTNPSAGVWNWTLYRKEGGYFDDPTWNNATYFISFRYTN